MDQHTPSTVHTAAPAPHRALDPSRPALLPCLIDDVLLAILDELAQHDYTYQGYKLRQQTLRSVCLASRRLRALAQPLLWRRVAISKSSQIVPLHAQRALGMNTTSCMLFDNGHLGVDWAVAVLATGAVLPNLQDLELSGGNKATLELSTVTSFQMTSLVAFWIDVKLDDVLSPAMLAQLEVIRIDGLCDVPVVAGLSPTVVVALPVDEPTLPRVSMYRTGPHLFGQTDMSRLTLSCLEKAIANNPAACADPPPIVLIPVQVVRLEDAEASSLPAVPSAGTWRGLEVLCAQKGVCLLWYDEDELEMSRQVVPPLFRRYARELKAWSLAESASSSSSR
ncbi:hypothetical protein JCM9279_006519 [Rhodotorula babjevae]